MKQQRDAKLKSERYAAENTIDGNMENARMTVFDVFSVFVKLESL